MGSGSESLLWENELFGVSRYVLPELWEAGGRGDKLLSGMRYTGRRNRGEFSATSRGRGVHPRGRGSSLRSCWKP